MISAIIGFIGSVVSGIWNGITVAVSAIYNALYIGLSNPVINTAVSLII